MTRELLTRILGPGLHELLCDDCFERLDAYVDLQLFGAAADEAVPGLRAHLEGCEACLEEYEGLLHLAGARAYA
jgi:hypothetical protein